MRSGDTAAFEILVRRYFRMTFLIAFAHLHDAHDAEDVCQDVFLQCWDRLDSCRDPARVGAWIAAITRNTAHNRRESRRVRETESLDALAIAASERSDVGAERNALRESLARALQALPPVQREVVLLHDLEGWKHAEIATRLDLSVVMSRRHLSDARKRLREHLGDYASLEPDHD